MTQGPRLWSAAAGLLLAGGGLLSACGGEDPRYESQAYVQNVSETGASVLMVTNEPSQLRVEVSRVDRPAAAAAAVGDDAPSRFHAARVAGLAPDTLYRYDVLDAVSGLFRGGATFRTAPLPGGRPITFAALGDSGRVEHVDELGPLAGVAGPIAERASPKREGDVVLTIQRFAPELVLHTGDVVYSKGEREHYVEGFFKPFAPLIAGTPLFPVLGNHDVKTENGAPFLEAFETPANNPEHSERYYSFDWGDVHFVALDTASPDALAGDGPQLTWLEEDLASRTRAWTVCVFHHPPHTQGGHGQNVASLELIVPILEAYGVDVVLNGHDHNYQRFYPINGITYVVTGGGGNELYDVNPDGLAHAEAVHHFVFGRADATRLDLMAIDVAGEVFDAVTLTK